MNISLNRWILNPIIVLFFLSVFLGSNAYLMSEQLHLVRIIPLVLIAVILWRNDYKIIQKGRSFKLLIFAAIFYYLYTLAVSLIFHHYLELNSLINFTVLFIVLIAAIILFNTEGQNALRVLFATSLVFYVTCILLAGYEITTGNHLPVSATNEYEWNQYIPTAFFTNTNDFCAMHVLVFIFLITYARKSEKPMAINFVLWLAPISAVIYIVASSRISIAIMFAAILVMTNSSQKLKIFLSSIILTVLLAYSSPEMNEQITQFVDSFFGMQLDMGDNSSSIRKALYEYGFLSVENSFGLGLGVNASPGYYSSISDPRLGGIINPHGYIVELWINGGVPVVLGYLTLLISLTLLLHKRPRFQFVVFLVFYNMLLFSSSSSLFLWPHYLVFIAMWFTYSILVPNSFRASKAIRMGSNV